MRTRRIVLHPQTREKLKRAAQRCTDADSRVRYLIVVRSGGGGSGRRLAKALGCCGSKARRTLDRYGAYGEAGLLDRSEDNGRPKDDHGGISASSNVGPIGIDSASGSARDERGRSTAGTIRHPQDAQ